MLSDSSTPRSDSGSVIGCRSVRSGDGQKSSAKRLNFALTPPSTEKDAKKKKSSDTINRLVCEAQGMDYQSTEQEIDTQELHTCILTRVNQVLGQSNMSNQEGQNLFMQQIIPALVTAVSLAVGETLERIFKQRSIITQDDYCKQQVGLATKLQANCLQLRYRNDQLEKYARRESVRVFGISEPDKENPDDLEERVLQVYRGCGVNVQASDISTMHRLGGRGRGRGPRAVLVKFISRRKKREVMVAKKSLKDKERYKGKVFINDDITTLSSRLLKYVKDLGMVEKAWTYEGKIWCSKKKIPGSAVSQSDRPICVETPDDLFRLRVNSIDYKVLRLEPLVLIE